MLAACLWLGSAVAAPLPGDLFKFDIQEQSPKAALQALADATGLRVVYGSADLMGVSVNPVVGEMNYDAALRRMLSGTGLTFRTDEFTGEVVILPRRAVYPRRPVR